MQEEKTEPQRTPLPVLAGVARGSGVCACAMARQATQPSPPSPWLVRELQFQTLGITVIILT